MACATHEDGGGAMKKAVNELHWGLEFITSIVVLALVSCYFSCS
jgi:hypothetical protein